MRLITVHAPQGKGKHVAQLAFQSGIEEAAVSPTTVFSSDGSTETKDVVEIHTATPSAKNFIDSFTASSLYDPATFAIAVRHPTSLFGSKPPAEEVHPFVLPSTDVYMDLYQFIKITWSLVGRVFLSAMLVAFGMVEEHLPIMVAGLLFLPYHHQMLGVALGANLKEWKFLGHSALALLVSTACIVAAGATVALFMEPPVMFDKFGTLLSGVALAVVIGSAAALGSTDDAGRKELIGLAATSHLTLIPTWFGLKLVFGFDAGDEPALRLLQFATNLVVLAASAGAVYALVGMHGVGVRRFVNRFR
jgi:hypothetical protein